MPTGGLMNDYITAIILGIVQGMTTFLPVSSTGHLIILEHFLGFQKPFANTFAVVVDLGAILSVVVYYWGRLMPSLSLLRPENESERKAFFMLWLKVAAATVPAVVVGGTFGKKIYEHLFNPSVVAVALFAGGVALVLIERMRREAKILDVTDISFKTAFYIGLVQCLSMIPGMSRSGSTIIGAILLGASRTVAAEFSFFLAIPTIAAASAYALAKGGLEMSTAQWGILAIGFAVSFLVALGVIALFMEYIKRRTFSAFGYYRIVLGLAVILYFWIWIS